MTKMILNVAVAVVALAAASLTFSPNAMADFNGGHKFRGHDFRHDSRGHDFRGHDFRRDWRGHDFQRHNNNYGYNYGHSWRRYYPVSYSVSAPTYTAPTYAAPTAPTYAPPSYAAPKAPAYAVPKATAYVAPMAPEAPKTVDCGCEAPPPPPPACGCQDNQETKQEMKQAMQETLDGAPGRRRKSF
jgi:hypothetical protein